MATFRATKAYHFSPDGTDENTWAKFDKVPQSDPPVFEAEVTKAKDVAALRKLITDKVAGYTDITEVKADETPAAKKAAAAEKAAADKAAAEKAAADKAAADGQGDANSAGQGSEGSGDGGDPAATGGDQNGS